MATCNGFARVRGLAKGECRRRRKVKTRTALQPRVPRRPRCIRAVRCRWCTVCSTPFVCYFQACTHLEGSTRPRTSMDMQLACLTYTPCFTRDGETVNSTTDYAATDLRRLCHLEIQDQTSGIPGAVKLLLCDDEMRPRSPCFNAAAPALQALGRQTVGKLAL